MKTGKYQDLFIKICLFILIFEIFYFCFDKHLIFLFKNISVPFIHLFSFLISYRLHLIIWGGAFAIAWIKRARYWQSLFQIALTHFVSGSIGYSLKIVLGRARPELFLKNQIYGYYGWHWDSLYHSFPSGHTLTAFTLATSLSFFYPRFKWLFLSLATCLSLSRVFLFRHYLSDVFGSAMIGMTIARFVYKTVLKTRYEAH